jgi:hypothetical protein
MFQNIFEPNVSLALRFYFVAIVKIHSLLYLFDNSKKSLQRWGSMYRYIVEPNVSSLLALGRSTSAFAPVTRPVHVDDCKMSTRVLSPIIMNDFFITNRKRWCVNIFWASLPHHSVDDFAEEEVYRLSAPHLVSDLLRRRASPCQFFVNWSDGSPIDFD